MNKEPRWFIRSHGHTLGPLGWGELESSLLAGDFGDEAKVSTDLDQTWVNLFEKSELKSILRQKELNRVRFAPLPPPSIYFGKKKKPFEKSESVIEDKAVEVIIPPLKVFAATVEKIEEPEEIIAPVKIKADLPSRPALDFSDLKPSITGPDQDPFLEIFRDVKRVERKIQAEKEISSTTLNSAPASSDPIFEKIIPSASQAISMEKNEFHFTIPKRFLWIVFAFAISAGAYFLFSTLEKTRDPKDSHLSDPPSPTMQPSEENDPILPLKAPTRPERD